MSTETLNARNETESEAMTFTKPLPEHQWLQNLVGSWTIESEMFVAPGMPVQTSTGTEVVKNFGGLWAFGEGTLTMPDGSVMQHHSALGYDVSFKEYRSCWFASVCSHLWNSVGTLSEDGKAMTLDCVGPDMQRDGQTANYRDVIELLDADHRTLTSYGQDEHGTWHPFMKARYTRV